MGMNNAAAQTIRVPYKLSFKAGGAPGETCMGWGNAGWTVAEFRVEDGPAALAFARAMPARSRMPSHARQLAQLEAQHAEALEALCKRGRG